MIFTEGDLKFDFSGAIDAFKFDDREPESPHYHGLSHCGMKAVDFIIERQEDWLFVEVKDYNHPSSSNNFDGNEKEIAQLILGLAKKYRDTFLYRWAEEKIDKPIRYICLVELSSPSTILMDKLKNKIPDNKPERWNRPIVKSVVVMNMREWNACFTTWPVTRVSEAL
ncbi:hypothetical protein MNBD_GAMMA04-1677 [hydrothermal vent metagenome]|uniref:Uncharacterized protein n=1 Tax=hydrothermal vent metagenome TaxID=652676 RepID=A0A3B0W3Z7_9ZZZZ